MQFTIVFTFSNNSAGGKWLFRPQSWFKEVKITVKIDVFTFDVKYVILTSSYNVDVIEEKVAVLILDHIPFRAS